MSEGFFVLGGCESEKTFSFNSALFLPADLHQIRITSLCIVLKNHRFKGHCQKNCRVCRTFGICPEFYDM